MSRARVEATTSSRAATSRAALRGLAAHLVSVREEEQARIAREIHDQLGQPLSALQLDLAWIRRRLFRPTAPAVGDDIWERLRAMSHLVDETIATTRRLVTDLRPATLEHLGLGEALAGQAREFEVRTGIRCVARATLGDRVFDPGVSTAVLRIAQEALANATRHSGASRVVVQVTAGRGALRLEVRDNGCGIPPAAVASRSSTGLIGMRERALQHRGEVVIGGVPGRGTSVRVRIPLAAKPRERRATP